MIERALRFAIVVSTAGSVMNEVLKNEFFRTRVQLVVADNDGPAAAIGRSHGIETVVIDEPDEERFGEQLAPLLRDASIDFVFSYYTKFYSAQVRAALRDRIINFHPSLLPAFKGADGFGDTVAYPARFAGNTVELIGEVMDEGKIVVQTVCPVDDNVPVSETRHQVFVHQCRALLQVARWLQEDRVVVDGQVVTVKEATFESLSFSPALDWPDAQTWTPPKTAQGAIGW